MTIEEYLERLLAGDADACVTEGRSRAVNLEGLEHLYLDLIEPSQYRVGELWEAGRISVAREHLATAINRYVMSACYAPLARATTGGQRAVITCTPGELHELGARMLPISSSTTGGTWTSTGHPCRQATWPVQFESPSLDSSACPRRWSCTSDW